MLTQTSLKLIAPVLDVLGLEERALEHDYWVLGPVGLGLKYNPLPQEKLELVIVVTKLGWDLKRQLKEHGLTSKIVISLADQRIGHEFQFKDFSIRVFSDEREMHEIADIRLFRAMQTLLDVHGAELRQVLERYLSYGLNLERGFIEYFGWSSDWRERLMALPDPSSHEAIVRFTC